MPQRRYNCRSIFFPDGNFGGKRLLMKKKPTIRDVAAMAGVSIATVSKFINSTQRFTAAVERKIQAAIQELEYHSNPLADAAV